MNIHIQDKKILSQTIELDRSEVNFLGPNLELCDCTVISETDAKGIVICGLAMHGGTFDQRVELENFHFENSNFSGVTFLGSYSGCDFGDWDDTLRSSVSECDFSKSNIHECRFLNCDMRKISTPPWPCFRLIAPGHARDFVMSLSWPKEIRLILGVYTDEDPECSATVLNANILASKTGLPLSEFRLFLEKIPGFEVRD